MALGQTLILVGDRLGFVPFAMASVLFSFALLPITLTRVSEPEPTAAPKFGLFELFAITPIGVLGAVGSGLLTGAFYSLGHVFGQRIGMSDTGTAIFVAATILGGAAFQWPVGHLSDRNDRRWVLLWVCVSGALVALTGFSLAFTSELALILLGTVFGGLIFTVYGLCVAHANDLVDRPRVLQVTGGLLLLHGVGATVGPTLAGGMMDLMGPGSLLLYFAGVMLLLALVAWRYIRLRPLNRGEPGQKAGYVPMRESSQAVLQLDPRGDDSVLPTASNSLY
jgi:MFS family permease